MIKEENEKSKNEILLKKFKESSEKRNIDIIVEEVNIDFFNQIFNLDNIDTGKSLQIYQKIGHQQGLLKELQIDDNIGVNNTEPSDIQSRISKFGPNDPIIKEPKSLFELIIECLEDPMLRILLVASLVSFLVGVAQSGWATGWIEGFSIFMAVFIVVSISSICNLSKEKQFARLNKENERKSVNVKRNKQKIEIKNEELVVGDIIYFEIGNVVCVDCIIINGSVEVDMSSLTGESKKIKKTQSKNPFLVSGSMITDGDCEAIVCAVGVNSYLGKSKIQIQDSDDKTPLQEKLGVLADQISKFGTLVSLLIFIVMIGREIFIRCFITFEPIFNSTMLDSIINAFIICITVIVVAVPEGLPMAVTISLAYSVLKMKNEENLVRHLDASETMGNVNNICTDKTGTLTEGNMFVRSFYFEETEQIGKNSNKQLINPDKHKLFIHSVMKNITAYLDEKDNSLDKYKGNSTECALLRFLIDNKIETGKIVSEKLIHRVPFKSENKYMGSIYYDSHDKNYQVYIKGAPEIIQNICNRSIDSSGSIVIFSKSQQSALSEKQIEYSCRSERTLAFAYCQINNASYNEILSKIDDNNPAEIFNNILIERNLIFVGMVGIADPPRPNVEQAIQKCHAAGVFVRMVTGDNINTALSIAREVSIINDYEYNLTKERQIAKDDVDEIRTNQIFYAIEGKVFRNLCGGYHQIDDENSPGTKVYKLKDVEKFKQVIENLKVIARASPDDKFLLVLGLKELKNIVAVTGDGTNDAPALKKSDVGFAMGKKGTDIAKDASDIVLLNDSFISIVTAIKYGRNVYDCIRKFIQFQLTTNIVAVFMTLLGGILLKDAPLNAIQMLWVNLIMDSLASLALATEDPTDKLLERKPYSRETSMVTPSMIRNILIQAIFQIIVLTIFIYYGDVLFGVPDDRNLSHFEWNEINGYHFTLFFNIFVFLQVFNSINARKLEQNEINVLENITDNKIYLSVQAFIVIGQIMMVQFGGRALRTQKLTFKQHFACIGIASFSLLFGYLGKIINYKTDLPTGDQILEKMENVSNSFKDKLPSRGNSFRGNTRTNMNISNKKSFNG